MHGEMVSEDVRREARESAGAGKDAGSDVSENRRSTGRAGVGTHEADGTCPRADPRGIGAQRVPGVLKDDQWPKYCDPRSRRHGGQP